MVDSGADGNVIDFKFASEHSIPLVKLPVHKDVNALDGRFLANVTHMTTPLTLLTSGNHRELIQLLSHHLSTLPFSTGVTLA